MGPKRTYFKESFYIEDYRKLQLPDFWIEEEPANWTATNYLIKLIQCNPGIEKITGNRMMTEDSKLVLKHVIPGTFADTAINMMIKNKDTKRGKDAINYLWKRSEGISKAQIDYAIQKLEFRSSIATEVNQDGRQNLGKRMREEEEEEDNQAELGEGSASSSSDIGVTKTQGDQNEKDENIWLEWQRFLTDPLRHNLYEPLSPEGNNVIWCGNSVVRRCGFPQVLYTRLLTKFTRAPIVGVSQELQGALDLVFDAATIEEYDEGIEKLRGKRANSTTEIKLEVDFFVYMMERFKELYEDDEDKLGHSEACLNYDLSLPCLKAPIILLRKRGYVVSVFPGEEELQSMTEQQQQQGLKDSRYIYKADGVVRSESTDEILILETSSAYNSASDDKASFDHYKAMFGLLAVMKTIAEKWEYASLDHLKKLKLHFVHVHGTAIRWWSMSIPEKDVFVMYKERRAKIPNDFDQKDTELFPFIQLHLDLSAGLQETIECLKMIKASHKDALQKMRYKNANPPTSMRGVIDPLVIRFTEGKHCQLVRSGP